MTNIFAGTNSQNNVACPYVCVFWYMHTYMAQLSQVRIGLSKSGVFKHVGSHVSRAPEFEDDNWYVD